MLVPNGLPVHRRLRSRRWIDSQKIRYPGSTHCDGFQEIRKIKSRWKDRRHLPNPATSVHRRCRRPPWHRAVFESQLRFYHWEFIKRIQFIGAFEWRTLQGTSDSSELSYEKEPNKVWWGLRYRQGKETWSINQWKFCRSTEKSLVLIKHRKMAWPAYSKKQGQPFGFNYSLWYCIQIKMNQH